MNSKTFDNIITFCDLEQATIDAIKLFGNKNTKNVFLEKSYQEYMTDYTDAITGEVRRGYLDVIAELQARFSQPDDIILNKIKKRLLNSLASIYMLIIYYKIMMSLLAYRHYSTSI